MRIAALIGEPACGKSTLAKAVIEKLGKPHNTLQRGLVRGSVHGLTYVVGLYPEGETFGGTDRLSMAVQPQMVDFLRDLKDSTTRVFFEGDRLGNAKFLKLASEIGDLRVFVLQASEETKARRHKERGDDQNEAFLKRCKTKVSNIMKEFPNAVILQNESEEDLRAACEKIHLYLQHG